MSIKDKYTVKSIDKFQCKDWLIHKHYAKRMPSITYSFGLFDDTNTLVGVCTFGAPPSIHLQNCCTEKYKDFTIELNRLVKNDDLEKNVQSFFVSRCFKLLPQPLIIISYSDPNYGHNGYTYQALNFLYTGKVGMGVEYLINGKKITARHMKKHWFLENKLPFNDSITINENFTNAGGEVLEMEMKNRYIYFLGSKKQIKDMKSNLTYEILPYPKGENIRYDSSHKATVQKTLF